MCDACLQTGSPWLPDLHGGRPRPRARPQLRLARRKVQKAVSKAAKVPPKPAI